MPITGPPLAQPIVLTDILAVGLATKPDDLALVSNESRWTWRELDAASKRLAAHYLHLGLKPGDRVASLLPNRGALFVHYLACHRAGLVATPLNYRYQAPEIDHALEVSGASILVAHAERDADLAQSTAGRQIAARPHHVRRHGRPAADASKSFIANAAAADQPCRRRAATPSRSSSSPPAAPANRRASRTRTKRSAG